jgi:hypothetical protein
VDLMGLAAKEFIFISSDNANLISTEKDAIRI